MFSTLYTRFGIPGVISVIALVFAMLGGAYAASNNGGGKASASKTKVVKGPRGPKGATGPAGPVGPQGPAGANGKDGSNGSNGSPGADGKSVTGEPIAAGGACGAGVTGVKYTLNATSTNVCNGKKGNDGTDGADGAEGQPWTPNNTLPIGAMETGVWQTPPALKANEKVVTPISFTIPLANTLSNTNGHFIMKNGKELTGETLQEQSSSACKGTVNAPTAEPGNVCVYFRTEIDTLLTYGTTPTFANPGEGFKNLANDNTSLEAIGRSGFLLQLTEMRNIGGIAYGTWAVAGA